MDLQVTAVEVAIDLIDQRLGLQQVDGSAVITQTIQLRFNPADNLYDEG